MKLYSTRNVNIVASAKEAIIKGLAEDGGLFTPNFFDIQDKKLKIEDLLKLSYKDIAKKVFSILLSDFSEEELDKAINGAYNKENFGPYSETVAPTTEIGEDFLLELYHGPTSAFKDVALTILPHFLTIANNTLEASGNKNQNHKVYILTATSGDTGKAALSGFRDVDGTFITVFYPTDGVSDIQKLQMNTSLGDNVSVVAIKGDFDDCQRLVKEIYTDKTIKNLADENSMIMSSANSINIGRLVPQIIYYIYSYVNLVNNKKISCGDKINFVVPTGNFGNILAGFVAKLLGTPIHKLICASNENNVLTDFINTGVYDRNRPLYKTISPSMDILVSSNLERLLFLLSDSNNDYIKSLMNELKEKGRYKVNDKLLSQIKENFEAFYANENECREAIKEAFEKDHRIIDTHTAIAYSCLKKYKNKNGTLCELTRRGDLTHRGELCEPATVILSTASPYKFAKFILPCITCDPIDNLDDFGKIHKLHDLTGEPIPENLLKLKDMKIRFDTTLSYDDCKKYVADKIKSKSLERSLKKGQL